MPGYQQVAVDSMGRVIGDEATVSAQPGDTLVTSIDAKVQSAVEQQLGRRHPDGTADRDPVTHRTTWPTRAPRSSSDAHTGRVVAMASQPTYDPSVWVGGISKKELSQLYSALAGRRCSAAPSRASSRPDPRGSR
jgi:penicillin-binding protein 2